MSATLSPGSTDRHGDGPTGVGPTKAGPGSPGPGSTDPGSTDPGSTGDTSSGGVPSPGQVARARLLSWRWGLLAAVAVTLAALVTVLISPHGTSDRLGPRNAAPNGSRALVRILQAHGVDVRLAEDSRVAVAATDTRSTLVVTHTELLGRAQLDRLAADDLADLVLVEPNQATLDRLAPGVQSADLLAPRVLDPGCEVPPAQAAGRARAGGFTYSAGPGTGADLIGTTVCYPDRDEPDEGSYLIQQRTDRKIVVIGQSDVLTNQYLGSNGDAALALTTLGEQPRLVWYTPDPLEPGGGSAQPGLLDLLPRWVPWSIAQLAVVVLLAMLWRSRRLGRLVSEPLPVVVRAAETQEGRARLYRQASARGRAGATLRTTTLRRLAARLAAPSGTTPDQLIPLVAAATGRDPQALGRLLLGPSPASDAELVQLADDLDAVQQDLTRRTPSARNPT